MAEKLGVGAGVSVQRGEAPIIAVERLPDIDRFGDTAGIEVERITGGKRKLIFAVADALHAGKDKACPGLQGTGSCPR